VSLGLAVFFGEGLCAGVPGNTCELTNPPQQDCAGGQPCLAQDATAVDLSPCETVVYQGRLAYFGAPRCGISDGVLGITLPNGTLVNVTPAGGIPLLASPGAFIDSNIVAYTVDPNDVDPVTQQLKATITYLGVSHASPTNGVASGSIDIFNGISPCPTPTECRTSVCDPEALDEQTGRVGLCVIGNLDESTPCTDTDGNACTTAGCDAAGNCAQDHIIQESTPCTDTDGNECTTAGCDATGICDQDHIIQESTPCTDTDLNDCTMAGCNAAGMCDQLHVTIPDCQPFCSSTILFDQSAALAAQSGARDTFFLRLGYNLQFAPYNPTTDGLKITLSNANGVIWSHAFLPGDIILKGRTWRYRNRTGIPNGIKSLTTSPRKDGLWRLRLTVKGDFSAATLAEMTVTVDAAGVSFPTTATWNQLPNGWQFSFRRF